MALLGGGVGGAGNPLGGSFTGTSKNLELVDGRCYAYSGIATITSSAEEVLLDFTTGNYIAVVEIQAISDQANGNDFDINYYFGGGKVGTSHIFQYSNSTWLGPGDPIRFVIPTYTDFKVTMQASGSDGGWAVLLTGTVHK